MQKAGSSHKNDPIANYNSAEQSKTFPLIPDQIHKVPENIRRALKVGKHRKNINVNINMNRNVSQKFENQANQNNKSLSNKKQNGLHVRQIFNFMDQNFPNQECQRYNKLQENFKQSTAVRFFKGEAGRAKLSGDRILYAKKKLTPIKKGLTVQPRSIISRDKRNFKVTFLNVQKLQLLKIYDNERQKQQLNNKTSMALSHTKSSLIQSFLQSTGLSLKNPVLRKSFYNNSPNKSKSKPFVPPFQRYHYRDFIWKCAYSYNIFHQSPQNYEQKFKVFIGKGNNSMLVKSLIKRRKGWYNFTEKSDQAHFVWTQIKINTIFNNQKSAKSIYTQIQPFCPYNNDEVTLSQQQKSVLKILDSHQHDHWTEYFNKFRKCEDTLDETMRKRNKVISNQFNKLTCKQLTKLDLKSLKIHNHLPNNYIISNKKALYYTMSKYYQKIGQNVFEYLPLTYHIQNGLQDPQYLKFLNSFYQRAKKIRARGRNSESPDKQKFEPPELQTPESPSRVSVHNMWIVKPGQFTNRGNGITVCMNLNQIKAILKKKQRHDNGNYKTYIIQSYIQKPFLYQKRKFDLRHYMMITSINGIIKGYWYELGYIRTTSFQYTTKHGLTSVHLTNDAVQKYLPQYGKYEKGNKVSYQEFQKYLEKQYGNQYNFYQQIYPRMKKIATDSIRACSIMIDPQKKGHNFEIFGMDFMIDGDFHPWLIQINNNPCLELSCPLLGQIIPFMVQNALKICIDSLIPPPANLQQRRSKFADNVFQTNKFELVYNSATEQQEIKRIFCGNCELDLDYKQLQKDQDEVFDDDGIQLED